MNAVSRSSEKKIKIKIMIDWTTKQAHQLLYATRRTISAPERKAYIMYCTGRSYFYLTAAR